MLYIGTKRQKGLLMDCIEEIDSQVIYEDNPSIINKLNADREHFYSVIERGIGIVNFPKEQEDFYELTD